MIKKLRKYIDNCKDVYNTKKNKQLEYSKKIVFTAKNGRKYNLKAINDYKQRTKSAVIENEISSILRVLYKNIAIFQTATIHPKHNIKTSSSIDGTIKKQYECFKSYHQHRWQFKIDKTRLESRNVKIYELSEKLNLHSNSVDVLNSTCELEHYIRALVCSRKKNDIGRVELLINEYTLKQVKKLFEKGIVVRINNKGKSLYLREEGDEFMIGGIGDRKASENYIYFKVLDKKTNSKRNLLRYIYKNILFERYENKPKIEHLVFSKLGIRLQQFSKDFFRRKVSKSILYRASSRLYILFRNKDNRMGLKPSKKDINSFIYFTAELFIKRKIFSINKLVFYKITINCYRQI